MEQQMKEHAQTEKAFLMMRACAGNANVQQMVGKFLSREQTYASLINQIKTLESKYDACKSANEAGCESLQKLKIANDNKKQLGFVHPNQADRNIEYEMRPEVTDNETERDYEKLSVELDELRTHLAQLKNRKT
jgi:S-formylglutathione hydrolase FrmB